MAESEAALSRLCLARRAPASRPAIWASVSPPPSGSEEEGRFQEESRTEKDANPRDCEAEWQEDEFERRSRLQRHPERVAIFDMESSALRI